uniref:Spermatogenesis-associated protein 20-like TRX domain-containing protein n=1 Tax=Magnetococcus massalia (strain MO-1) TaxID=451514 RepID=A0A1S7LNQ8_MAGMO|nr:Conserved protein of unknown function. Putative Spermatogenesis-associated protein. Containing six-hairpin glycosidase-like domain and thioredoxin fold domain [Candidatus Magnetococcus massalia]
MGARSGFARYLLLLSMLCLPLTGWGSQNRLAGSPSSYLRAHAQQPIHWQTWSEAVIARAKRESKLIFVSVGYAACHWCHVMAQETFSDAKVAALLNRHFISIKIDRELRPDLDNHFIQTLRRLNGRAGWPANLFLTPDLQPIQGGVYFPPEPRYGIPSFTQVITTLAQQWREQPEQIVALQQKSIAPQPTNSSPHDARTATRHLWAARFDAVYGGFDEKRKFPRPSLLGFWLDEARYAGDDAARSRVEHTLATMAVSGMRDMAGGLFHRYGTEANWTPPHFEIMLYDNAQLAMRYLEAAQAWRSPAARRVASRLLDVLIRDFSLPGGCFAASSDAVAEELEGGYFTWQEEELDQLLGRQAEGFKERWFDPFGLTVAERHVLAAQELPQSLATLTAWQERDASHWHTLAQARQARVAAKRYDAQNSAWNGLTIQALAHGAAWLQRPDWQQVAQRCMERLLKQHQTHGTLRHVDFKGQLSQNSFVQDYTTTLLALLALYDGDLNPRWITTAEQLALEMLDRFQPAPGEPLQTRPVTEHTSLPPEIQVEDDPEPSANAMAVDSLYRLAAITGQRQLEQQAKAIYEKLQHHPKVRAGRAPALLRSDWSAPQWRLEVAIVGKRSDPLVQQLLQATRAEGEVGMVLTLREPSQQLPADWPISKKPQWDDQATAYTCQALRCLPPVHDAASLTAQLRMLKRDTVALVHEKSPRQ